MASSARIEELKKKFDENPRRYFAPLANEYRKAGDLEAAIAICRAHLPQQPGHMSGHIVFGQTLFEAGQLAEAQTIFQTALELDPENLIALRHLGDIARGLGDDESARTWYTRVLEADPRNEEISSLLAAVDSGAGARASSTAEIVPPEGEERPSLGGSGTQVLDASAFRDLANRGKAADSAAGGTQVLDLGSWASELAASEPAPPVDEPAAPRLADDAPAGAVPSAGAPADAEPMPELEIPTSWTAGAGSAANAPQPTRVSGESILPPVPDASGVENLAGFEATEFQAPPAVERPASLAGLESMSEWATAAEKPPAPVQQPDETPTLIVPAATVPLVTETMAELLLSQGHRQQALGVYRQLVAQRPGDIALRDRLAELERAGGPTIRQLLGAIASWRPGQATTDPMGLPADQEVAPAQDSWGVSPATPATEPADDWSVPAPAAPSEWQDAPSPAPAELPDHQPEAWPPLETAQAAPEAEPQAEPQQPEPEPEPEAEPAFQVPAHPARSSGAFVVDESYVAPDAGGAPSANGAQPADPGPAPRGGSIDRLFGGVQVAEADTRAAHALAAAFASTPTTPEPAAEDEGAIRGEPARRAASELSLDQIFRPGGNAPKPGETRPAFSFDQFFGSGGGGSAAPAAESARPAASDTDDIQQFNSWLQGLKKR